MCVVEGSSEEAKGSQMSVWAELVLRIHGQHRVGGRNGFVPIRKGRLAGMLENSSSPPPGN